MSDPNGQGLEIKNRRMKFHTCKSCFVAKEMVDWLLINNIVASRPKAVAIGQKMHDVGLIEPGVKGKLKVNENAFSLILYRIGHAWLL